MYIRQVTDTKLPTIRTNFFPFAACSLNPRSMIVMAYQRASVRLIHVIQVKTCISVNNEWSTYCINGVLSDAQNVFTVFPESRAV